MYMYVYMHLSTTFTMHTFTMHTFTMHTFTMHTFPLYPHTYPQ